MNAKQLEALFIDQALGELSDEASALLETYLTQFPDRQTEADQIRKAVGLTEAAVASRPLVLQSDHSPEVIAFPKPLARFRTSLRVAAAITALALAVGTGFFAGKGTPVKNPPAETIAETARPATPSPWARYQFKEGGQLAVIVAADPKS